MTRFQDEGWPDFYDLENEVALVDAATDTLEVAKSLLLAADLRNNTRLAKVIQRCAESIIESVAVQSDERSEYQFDSNGMSKIFLALATQIENLLADLLQKKEEALNMSGQEELSDIMSKLNVAL